MFSEMFALIPLKSNKEFILETAQLQFDTRITAINP